MAVRKDSIQIKIDLEAQQGVKTYQKLTDQSKKLTSEIIKLKKAGKENTNEYKKLQGQLDKVNGEFTELGGKGATMGQMINRAKQLNRELLRTAEGSKRAFAIEKELLAINSRLATARKRTRGVAEGMDDIRRKSEPLPGIFSRIPKALALTGIIAGLALVARKLIEVGREAITFFNTQAKAEAALKTALDGNIEALERYKKRASEIQKVTLFGDEELIRQQAFLANLGLTEDQINKTLDAAVDLSAGLGISLDSAVKNLSKTYGGLTGELGESIPQLKNLTKEQLKTGKAVDFVAKQFEGQAEAAAKAGTGGLTQLENKVGDVKESIGLLITQGLERMLPTLNNVVDFTQKLVDTIISGEEATGKWAREINLLVKIFKFLGNTIGEIPLLFAGMVAAAQTAGDNVRNFFTRLSIDSQIAAKEIKKFFSFGGEVKRGLQKEIDSLKELQSNAIIAGKSIGDAFSDAYNLALARRINSRATLDFSDVGTVPIPGASSSSTPSSSSGSKGSSSSASKPRNTNPLQAITSVLPGELQSQPDYEVQQELLKSQFLRALTTEQEYEEERHRLQQLAFEQRLELIKEKNGEESLEYLQAQNQKLEHQKEHERQRLELTQRTEEARKMALQTGLNHFEGFVDSTIKLLKEEEKERGKSSVALKAFSAGKVIIDGVQEVQAIWKTANENPLNALFPGAGNAIAILKTAVAAARTRQALGKISGAGFYFGGYTGNQPIGIDTQGRGVTGVVHQNEWVAPEWQVNHPDYGPLINYLEQGRQRGFVEGGFTSANTTPSLQASSALGASTPIGSNQVLNGIKNEIVASNQILAKTIQRKQFFIYSGQLVEALDEESTLTQESTF